jgi:hypothetical protein
MTINLYQVALITCFFSFGVQFLFWAWYKIRREPIIKNYKTVFSYSSGYIGDLICMPATNVFAVIALDRLGNPYLDFSVWMWAIFVGLITTFIFHQGQKHFNLVNWTMPQKGKWTLLGVYHSLFMFAESSFLAFSLISYVKHLTTVGPGSLAGHAIQLGLGIMFLFFVTFVYDYWKPLFRPLLMKK